MKKKNKSILQATVFALPFSLKLNQKLNNNFKTDYLTMYPKFKITNEFRNNISIKSISFFSTLYFFLRKFEKYKLIKKLNIFFQKISYYRIDNYMKKIKENYDIFILQATLGKEIAPLIRDKIKLLDKYSAHAELEKNMSKKEFMFRNIKIPFNELFSANEFEHNRELEEYKIADRILVQSNFAYKSFIDMGFDKNKIKIIKDFGFDSKNFYPLDYKYNNFFNIIYVGRITLNKGVAYLIEAFEKLEITNKKLKLYGIISKDFQEYLKNIKLNDNIEILNPVKHSELKYIYSSSEVLVQPSLFDGWSMVVTEALACGCPVVTTTNTGASDIIIEDINGYVGPTMDSNSIANNLKKIYSSKIYLERRKISKTVEKYKDWNLYCSNYKDFIETL
jgi:glycosyltransferase involved in cell wall biosynthesis